MTAGDRLARAAKAILDSVRPLETGPILRSAEDFDPAAHQAELDRLYGPVVLHEAPPRRPLPPRGRH